MTHSRDKENRSGKRPEQRREPPHTGSSQNNGLTRADLAEWTRSGNWPSFHSDPGAGSSRDHHSKRHEGESSSAVHEDPMETDTDASQHGNKGSIDLTGTLPSPQITGEHLPQHHHESHHDKDWEKRKRDPRRRGRHGSHKDEKLRRRDRKDKDDSGGPTDITFGLGILKIRH